MSGGQIRLKYVASLNPETLPEDTPGETEVKYIDIGSVGRGHLVEKPQVLLFEEAPSRARRIVRTGDTIVSSVRTYLRAVLPIDQDLSGAIASTGFVVVRPTDANARFVAWSLQSTRFVDEVVARSVGVSYPAIAPTEFGTIEVRVPPLPTQRKIAGFLDRETERIDALVDKKRCLIDLLEEKRTATITHAVTKGLDPTAPMKPSGIPWIGEIPAHWHIGQLKHVIDETQTGPFGSQVHNADYICDGVPLVNPMNIRYNTIVADREVSVSETKASELARHRLAEHDIVLSRRGEMGRCALVTEKEAGWLCGTGSMRLRVTSGINPRYITHLIRSTPMTEYFGLHSVGSTMDNLSAATVGEAPVALPTTDEQDEIALEIERIVGGTLEATSCLNRQLSLLAEYREALITAAVTGKIDVDTFDNDRHLEAATQ